VARADESVFFRDLGFLERCAHVRALFVYGVELTPDAKEKHRASADVDDAPSILWEFFLRKDFDPIHAALLSGGWTPQLYSSLPAAQINPVRGCL
jgi:hypothetical protein